MIPSEKEAKQLWETYNLPENKRQHVTLVAKVAVFLARELKAKQGIAVNENLILAAALLHDIDKNMEKLPGDSHPDAGVRMLQEKGMPEVTEVVKRHPVHAILDPKIAPRTWEEKLVFLADKTVKYDVITVDTRFSLWRAEELPRESREILEATYPKVKALEQEIFSMIGIAPEDLAKRVY